MFDRAFGLPLHVLVNHLTIVFVPLTVLAALAFAVVPRWRWLLRLPMVAGAVISLVATFVTVRSGYALYDRLNRPAVVEVHEHRGQLLQWIVLAFVVWCLVSAYVLGGPGAPTPRWEVGRRRAAGIARPVRIVVAVVLVVLAVATGIQVVLTGDAGARAVWGAGG
ncbi:hypothetical protein SAMN05421678_115165 [Actinopolymorpha cephalotaxi]|uniref:Membrane protein n=1 Tax=Actinopolymorpha cephalotaxi TaxID=504797 RepID=A0A1I2Z3R1_9ACTN|nr:DUF2231 domain-containing protein [Actinopolymorpha cephalotaxi]NYH81846.1 putative membrane protein [Actinopolymorpha cephalotaxi]SFH32512.1 hypothetical protein SAMN05421678_115165 [Actinopolymorpha cephalotaxi]